MVKSIDLVGVSELGWEDAALKALEEAAKTVRHIERLDVVEYYALVEDQKIKEYRARVRLHFRVER